MYIDIQLYDARVAMVRPCDKYAGIKFIQRYHTKTIGANRVLTKPTRPIIVLS